jgi:hypothetical protein
MEQRQEPIEGANDSQTTEPTRTGDNVPTSNITPQETKTMAAVPITFIGIAMAIAVIFMVIFILVR